MNRRVARAAAAALATVAFAALSGCSSGRADTDGSSESGVEASTVLSVPGGVGDGGERASSTAPSGAPVPVPLSELIDTVEWPQDVVAVRLAADAREQLEKQVTDDVRLASFVQSIDAVGLGRGNQGIGAVLLLRVATGAATDPGFRGSLAESLALHEVDPASASWDVARVGGQAGLSVRWFGELVVVVETALDEDRAEVVSSLNRALG